MRIKKLTAVAMTGMMVFGMGTSVFAASQITTVGGSDTGEVKAKYVADAKAETVYSVDIEWGSMEYTYTIASEGTWDPATHTFKNASAGAWSCGEHDNEVKVTNHSNAAVKASFKYAAEEGYDEISGTFNKNIADLATAEGTAVEEAPTETVSLNLEGALDKNVTNPTQIGTATVTLDTAE